MTKKVLIVAISVLVVSFVSLCQTCNAEVSLRHFNEAIGVLSNFEENTLLLVNRIAHAIKSSNTSVGEEESLIYSTFIVESSLEYDLDPFLVTALAFVESKFNPRATNKRKTTVGIMQIHQPTWKLKDPHNIRLNINFGCKILKELIQKYPESYLRRYAGFGDSKTEKSISYVRKVRKIEKQLKAQSSF